MIKPDYTVTRGVVYTKLAANFIRKTKNLYVVNLVDHEDDPSMEARDWDPQDESRMPSWVPDWHSINRTTPLPYLVAAAEVEDAEIRVDGETEGAKGTSMPHLLVRGWVVDEISAVSRRMETTDFPVTYLARELAKKNPFWLDRLWELVFPAADSTHRDALAVLETLSLALVLGTREKDQPMSSAGPSQTLEEHQRSFAAYVLEYHELRHGAPESARSLYDSLPVDTQAELRRRAEGTTGGRFVECMTWPSMWRVVYRTRSGLVGMGSRVTRPGTWYSTSLLVVNEAIVLTAFFYSAHTTGMTSRLSMDVPRDDAAPRAWGETACPPVSMVAGDLKTCGHVVGVQGPVVRGRG